MRYRKQFNERLKFVTKPTHEKCNGCFETIGNRNWIEAGRERILRLCVDCSGMWMFLLCQKKETYELFDWIVAMVKKYGTHNPNVYKTFSEVPGFTKKEDAKAWARDVLEFIKAEDPDLTVLPKLDRKTVDFLNSSRGEPWRSSDPLPVKPPKE